MSRGAVLVGVALCLAGCMTYPDQVAGGVGIGLGDDGQPVVHFASCGSPVVEVVVLQGREGLAEDEENAVVGEWRLDRPATQGFLDLANTAAEGEFLGFDDGVTYLVDVRLEDDKARLAGVELELADLDALGTDQVLAAEDRVVTVHELAGDCPPGDSPLGAGPDGRRGDVAGSNAPPVGGWGDGPAHSLTVRRLSPG